MSTYLELKSATSICTMSHETTVEIDRYSRKCFDQAEMVDAGLITFDEAKRAVLAA